MDKIGAKVLADIFPYPQVLLQGLCEGATIVQDYTIKRSRNGKRHDCSWMEPGVRRVFNMVVSVTENNG